MELSGTQKALIRDSVERGSVFLSLEQNIFSHKELLLWLSTEKVSPMTSIAYKALCKGVEVGDQYLTEGAHFLVKKPDHSPVAVEYCEDLGTIRDNLSGEENPVIAHVCDEIIKAKEDKETKRFYKLILSGNMGKQFSRENVVICFKARCFPYIAELSTEECNQCLLEADWPGMLRYSDPSLPGLVIKRLLFLRDNLGNYFTKILPGYKNTAERLRKENMLSCLSPEQLADFSRLFPAVVDARILGYSRLGQKLSLSRGEYAGYVLGYPIQFFTPSEEQIRGAVEKLEQVGKVEYSDLVKNSHELHYPFQGITFCKTRYTFSNDKDVMMEEISNYAPFDVVFYQTGTYIYRFSRPEFPKILESKKNPWTNEWLPENILHEIEAREKTAQSMKLPSSLPYPDLFNLEDPVIPEEEHGTISDAHGVRVFLDMSDEGLLSAMLRGGELGRAFFGI